MEALLGILLLVSTAVGFGYCYLGFLWLTGRMGRGARLGIRVSTVTASDETWRAAHRAAGPILLLGGAPVLAAGLAFFPFAFAGRIDALFAVVIVMVSAGVLVGTTFSALTSGLAAANGVTAAPPG